MPAWNRNSQQTAPIPIIKAIWKLALARFAGKVLLVTFESSILSAKSLSEFGFNLYFRIRKRPKGPPTSADTRTPRVHIDKERFVPSARFISSRNPPNCSEMPVPPAMDIELAVKAISLSRSKIEERDRLRMFCAKMSTIMPTSRSAKVEKLRLIRLKSI